jgi:hypothetical protein
MQVRTNLSQAELRDATRLARPKSFWFRFALANWYATAVCVGIIAVAIHALIEHQQPSWKGLGIFFLLGCVRFAISWNRWNERLKKAGEKANAGLSTRSLDTDGIRTTLVSGASSFAPWSSFTKWTEGKRLFVLTGSDGPVVLPIDEGNRDSLRSLLQSHIAVSLTR